jgi:hypothetical protein
MAHTRLLAYQCGSVEVRADLWHVTYFVYITLVFRAQSKPAFCSLSFRPDPATPGSGMNWGYQNADIEVFDDFSTGLDCSDPWDMLGLVTDVLGKVMASWRQQIW